MTQWIAETPLFAGAQGVTSGRSKNLQLLGGSAMSAHYPNQNAGASAPEAGPQTAAYDPQYQPHYHNFVPRAVLDFEKFSLLSKSVSAGPGDHGARGAKAAGFQPKNYSGFFAKARGSKDRDWGESVNDGS